MLKSCVLSEFLSTLRRKFSRSSPHSFFCVINASVTARYGFQPESLRSVTLKLVDQLLDLDLKLSIVLYLILNGAEGVHYSGMVF